MREHAQESLFVTPQMGKGVSFLESREKTHFIRVDEHEWDDALNILTHYGQ